MKTIHTLAYFFLLSLMANHAVAEEEFLDVDDAFRISVEAKDANTVRASWEVADGYYLYRDRFGFSSGDEQTTVTDPVYPEAEYKYDENFGDVYVYHHSVTIDIPVVANSGTASVKIKWQGCAEAGLCYPPQKKVFTIALPQQSSGGGLDTLLGGAPSSTSAEPLHEDQAFQLESRVENNLLILEWTMPENYYLYQDKVSAVSDDLTIGKFAFDDATIIDDEHFGEVSVFFNSARAIAPLSNISGSSATIKVSYQGCLKDSICYPPITKTVKHNVTATGADLAGDEQTEEDLLQSYLGGNTIVMFFMFMLLGLGLAFTPCVLPMVPILSSIITGQGENLSTRTAFGLSLTYVLAMALTFAGAGAFVGSAGTQALQNPVVLSGFALLLFLLSLSMFGLYKLQLPNFIQSKVTEISNRQEGGSHVGVAIMGVLSALIVGPCVTAPLAAALVFIANTGSIAIGFIALLGLGLGMGIPLLLVGTAAGTMLPKAGTWMMRVQHIFGFVILGLALWMLKTVLDASVLAALWGILLISLGVYFNALDHNSDRAPGWHTLGRTIGLASLLWGILILIGVASGGNSLFKPLGNLGIAAGSSQVIAKEHGIKFRTAKDVAELDALVADAAKNGKHAMFDLYADWCTSCLEYEHVTFADPGVRSLLSDFVLIKVDITDDETFQGYDELRERHTIVGPPTLVFYDKAGAAINNAKIVGFKKPGPFTDHVNKYVLK